MTTLFKLTNQSGDTQNATHWGVGVTHKTEKCENPQLCSKDVFHAYTNKNLAFLLNPTGANINDPLVWECEGEIAVKDYGKVGCFSLTITKKLKPPKWTKDDKSTHLVRVAFAILCAESVIKVYEDKYPNDDRPRKAIEAAKKYIKKPSRSAAHAAADAAAHAAADEIDFGMLADRAVEMVMK
jgi:hypothetical protein